MARDVQQIIRQTMKDPELDALRSEFLVEAARKALEISTSIAGTPDLERLAHLAHQLKGSGGSYGYPLISAAAAAIERAAGDASLRSSLGEHADCLRSEIEKAQRALNGAA